MKVYYLLVSACCVWIAPAQSQFYYSHYTPLTQISPYFPQPYLPALPAVSPLAYTLPQSQAGSTSAASVTYNIPSAPSSEFRGFGYRTDFQNGGSATVFYVTGAEAESLRNFKDFPNFRKNVLESPVGKARSLASDIIDVNAVPDAGEKIQSVLQPVDFQKIFETLTPGIVNFYSNFPAATVPLDVALKIANGTSNVTTTTTTAAPEEAQAAESVVNAKVVINDVDNIIKANETSESTTVSEAPQASSTTETAAETKSTESSSTGEEKSTASNEEATTVETTTQV
ncbi:uncharacterized protein LOC135141817 [Zophobas morio]|uniref:uncharacterized protein LOC135141817 n=1 Tax=Zophobas morio TaxID=2755281 RepID=UPI003082C241